MPEKILDFKKLKTKEKILLIGLVIAIVFGVYIQAIHKPLSRKADRFKFQTQKSKSRINELKGNFPQLDKQRQNIQSANAELENLLEEIKETEKRLPGKQNTSQLLSEFSRLAKGVKMESIKQKIDAGDEYSRIFIELQFNTPYKKTLNYIRDIEAMSPFLTIEQLDMSEPKGKEAGLDTSVRLIISSLLGDTPFTEQFEAQEPKEAIPVVRDIFISKTKPVTKISKTDLKLEGITFSPESPTAIINSDVVKVGSQVGDLMVKEILPDAVILSDDVEDYVLSIGR